MVPYWNTVLNSYNSDLTVLSYDGQVIKLSNGVILSGKLEIQSFRRRLSKHPTLIDEIYSTDTSISTSARKRIKSLGCRQGGLAAQRLYPELRKNMNTGIPWNKGTVGMVNIWNKGLTKEIDDRVLKHFSQGRLGDKNPAFGKPVSDELKEQKSNHMKHLILEGLFTPPVHNSLTRKNLEFNGKKYRSSWEVLFAFLHPDFLYEKVRIPYKDSGKPKVHITDFLDPTNNIIYEIKPECNRKKITTKLRESIKWCKKNGYTYVLITENELFGNVDTNIFENFEPHVRRLLTGAYNAFQKNQKHRNCKT